jgi:hypothetical protein
VRWLAFLILPALLPAADSMPEMLWRAPRPMTAQDWTCGPGGCDRAPAPPFQFVDEDVSGTNTKVTIKDARGRTWNVKFGGEVIPECFASRFLMALGYFSEPVYFVGSGQIQGAQNLRRAGRMIDKGGTFRNGRFELRGESDFVFLKDHAWSWDKNPFRGSHELAGLKIVMMLLSNWDAKDARDGDESNNGVFRFQAEDDPALAYTVFDWGASLGRWGGLLRRDESDCSGYVQDTPSFIKGVHQGQIEWGYSGKRTNDITTGIRVSDVQWLMPYLLRITPQQLRTGLEASGATKRQAACWSAALENRIQQLAAAAK